ncbi:MAG: Asp-tRNA(Asn)/Glu-tRNA(Gln) amidotransferase subunit GatB [Deltaproteobacteria bacterium]|nr:Asp-tRNA(Asn)/Glu-tRNA(Gln) amidotransferase subunit GatB [Deltaproteobacteria bacterium]
METMEPVIGLEIHAQLNTRTKLFCACPTEFGAVPNTNVCEVCTGQPGALPRMNGKALELAAKAGLALGSAVNRESLFSRKNYFYPDLPNGFQTSQLDPPICQGGSLTLELGDGTEKTVRLNRIHMEDDAGKCLHDEKRGLSLVDLNRAGTPLIEIVTEPDLSSASEAVNFLKKLHALLVRLGVTKGRMEEGEFRCDVNISLKPKGSPVLGTRAEIKNLNSFKFVGQAIEYEIERQTGVYGRGGSVSQETLHFDSEKGETRSLRSKEEAHDYRYFPQPDLPPVEISGELLARLRETLPPTPEEAKKRLVALGLKPRQAELLLERPGAPEYFHEAHKIDDDAPRIYSLMEELFLPACQKEGLDPSDSLFAPPKLAALAKLLRDGTVGRRKAQELFPDFFAKGSDPSEAVRSGNLSQITDPSELLPMVEKVAGAFEKEAKKFLSGEEKILSFLVGQVMKESRGRACPKTSAELMKNHVKERFAGAAKETV